MASKGDIVRHVMLMLNEADATVDGALVDGASTDVAQYVEGMIPSAWRKAAGTFPLSWLGYSDYGNLAEAHGDGPRGAGYVFLPGGFLRLWSFRMKGWKVPCRQALEATPAVERKQSNVYTRGTPERPVCVLGTALEVDPVDGSESVRDALWYYSLPCSADAGGHVVEEFLYVSELERGYDDVPVTDRGYEPFCRLLASMVLVSFEKYDAAKAMGQLTV